jgi:hypothetical protein
MHCPPLHCRQNNFTITANPANVTLFDDIIVPYIQSAYLIGGTYTFGVKSCQEVKSQFIGAPPGIASIFLIVSGADPS